MCYIMNIMEWFIYSNFETLQRYSRNIYFVKYIIFSWDSSELVAFRRNTSIYVIVSTIMNWIMKKYFDTTCGNHPGSDFGLAPLSFWHPKFAASLVHSLICPGSVYKACNACLNFAVLVWYPWVVFDLRFSICSLGYVETEYIHHIQGL